ncbi:hypothetical protein H7F30_14070 [Dermacoccus sp. PAMC28757]|uniref:hypothetical protein n=1 Tax=Dermacoccus sp. PAMC28757 TaxID=2762331 RepID=UPI00164E79D4|nr:hypothetical protein [Dermacoccus sp. PAMC28757]QNK52668.1 hypothetical protein H7F30_14070 [Dermacoccus sp. PAMC28757]
MSKWIPILVRTDYVQNVMDLLASLEQDFPDSIKPGKQVTITPETTAVGSPALSDIDPLESDELTWSVEDLKRLAAGSTVTTRRWTLAMDACAEHPGEYFSTSEIAEMTGMSIAEWRDAPRKITRHLKTHYEAIPLNADGNQAWPLRARTRPEHPDEVSWMMTPATAERWKQARA